MSLSGCFINSKVSCVDDACASKLDTPYTIQISGVLGGSDSVEDQALFSTGDPKISFSSSQNTMKAAVSITSADGATSYCSKDFTNPISPITIASCNLVNGTYKVKIIGTTADGATSENSLTFVRSIMSPLLSPLLAVTGEQINLSPTAGFPSFTAQAGSGYLDMSSFLYNVPLTANNGTETVRFTDRFGQYSDQVIDVRKFTDIFGLIATDTVSVQPKFLGMTDDGTNLYGLAALNPWGIVGAKPAQYAIYKSTNNGSSWTKFSMPIIPGAEIIHFRIAKLYYNAGAFYIFGGYTSASGQVKWYVGKSSDDGLTWQNIYTFGHLTYDTFNSSMTFTSNGYYLLGGYAAKSSSPYYGAWIIKRCSIATNVCTDVDFESTTAFTGSGIIEFQKDGSGNIYVAGTLTTSFAMYAMVVKKSSDQGATWTTIHSSPLFFSHEYFTSFSISSDGAKMAIGGGTTTAYLFRSEDSGATFTTIGVPCSANGWQIYDTEINAAKSILFTCFGSPSMVDFYAMASVTNGTNAISGYHTTTTATRLYKKSDGLVINYSYLQNSILRSTADWGSTFTSLTYPSPDLVNGDGYLNSFANVSSTLAYATGYVTLSSGSTTGVIYKTSDSGATWSLDHTWADVSTKLLALTRVPSSTTLYAGGVKTSSIWQIYKNSNGVNWVSSDTFDHPTGSFMELNKILSTADGRVYAIGSYTTSAYVAYARYSVDSGATWNQFDDYSLPGGHNMYLGGFVDGADVWLAGYSTAAGPIAKWLIRHHNGSTWTTEDESDFGGTTSAASATGAFKSSDGTIYSIGKYKNGLDQHWVVKKRNTNGTWAISDDFISGKASPSDITEVNGVVYVSGMAAVGTNSESAIVRMLKNGKWHTIDLKNEYGVGQLTSISPCFTQSLCTTGMTSIIGPTLKAFVRKLNLF